MKETQRLIFRLTGDSAEASVDLAKLKVAPGEHTIAFYGGAVAKYSHHPGAVSIAEAVLAKLKDESAELAKQATQLASSVKTASPAEKQNLEASLKKVTAKQAEMKTSVAAATRRVSDAKKLSRQKDIVDIVVSQPISIRVQPAEKK